MEYGINDDKDSTIDRDLPTLKHCSKCILPENFPGIQLNSEGICNFCVSDTIIGDQDYHLSSAEREKLNHELKAILKTRNRKAPWDVLVGMSGGKDSTMLAVRLKRDYGLRVLGYTFDAGFNSEIAIQNLRTTLKKLQIAHVYYTLPRSLFLKVLRYYLSELSKPLLETVCRICGALYGNIGRKLAIQKKIPLIAYGWARGQGPVPPHYLLPRDYFMNEIKMPDALFWNEFEEEERNYLWELYAHQIVPIIPMRHRKSLAKRYGTNLPRSLIRTYPLVLTPYKIWEYLPQDNLRDVVELGLIDDGKSHPIDTNCKLIPLFSRVDSKIYGFNPFLIDIADHVREGNYDREEWLNIFEEMDQPAWRYEQIQGILDEIAMDWDSLRG